MPDPRLLIVVPGPGLVAVSFTALPTVALAPGPTVAEGDPAVFTITLSAPTAVEVGVDYETADDSAVAGTDYEAARGTVTIPAGETTATVTVPTIVGVAEHPTRAFALILSAAHAPVGEATGALVITDAWALATIQADPVVPPVEPEGEGPHTYFDELRTSGYVLTVGGTPIAYSLRDQAQLNALVGAEVSTSFSYAPDTDTYADPQDAAKLVIPGGATTSGIPSSQIPNFNAPPWNQNPANCDRLLYIWDVYWGPEFSAHCGTMTSIKSVGIQNANGTWWTVYQNPGAAANCEDPTVACMRQETWTRHGVQMTGDWRWAEGVMAVEPFWPSGEGAANAANAQHQVRLYESQWARFIFEVIPAAPPEAFTSWNTFIREFHNDPTLTLSPNQCDIEMGGSGRWRMISSWVVREDGTIARVSYKAPVGWGKNVINNLTGLRFTLDSSKHGTTGDIIGYWRNLVVLKNYRLPEVNPESDTFIFRPPVRGPVSRR